MDAQQNWCGEEDRAVPTFRTCGKNCCMFSSWKFILYFEFVWTKDDNIKVYCTLYKRQSGLKKNSKLEEAFRDLLSTSASCPSMSSHRFKNTFFPKVVLVLNAANFLFIYYFILNKKMVSVIDSWYQHKQLPISIFNISDYQTQWRGWLFC